jgi:hypothetical protein
MSKLGLKVFFKNNNYTIMLTTMTTQELYVVAKQKKNKENICGKGGKIVT